MNLSTGEVCGLLGVAGGVLLMLRTLLGVADSNLVLMSRSRIRQQAEEGDARAARLEQVLEDRHTVHTSLSVCRSTMSVALGGIAVWAPAVLDRGAVAEATTLALTGLLTVFLELSARRLAWSDPDRLGLMLVPFYGGVRRLARPFLKPMSVLASGVAGLLGSHPALEAERGVTGDDIRLMVDEGRDLAESEKEMIHSIFDLSETIAREVMVPRVDMVAVERGSAPAEALERCLEKGLSRLPVYESTVDNVVGIVTVKDLLALVREGRSDGRLAEVLRPAVYVPTSKRVDELLREMQRDRVAMAIVVDEYGGTDGLVTMEDLIEEIVGKITDEYDEPEPSVDVSVDGSVLLDARMIIEDVNEMLGTSIPADEYETVGGFVYGQLGHSPKQGEQVVRDGLVVSVDQVRGQRITRVRVARENGAALEVAGAAPTPMQKPSRS